MPEDLRTAVKEAVDKAVCIRHLVRDFILSSSRDGYKDNAPSLGGYGGDGDDVTVRKYYNDEIRRCINNALEALIRGEEDSNHAVRDALCIVGDDALSSFLDGDGQVPDIHSLLEKALLSQVFLFRDIVYLDDRAVQKILYEVDAKTFGLALAGMDKEVQEKVLRNLPRIAREDVQYSISKTNLKDDAFKANIQEARSNIIAAVYRLEDSGEIVIVHPKHFFPCIQ